MPLKTGFDNGKYLQGQTEAILKRVKRFDHKLYLEFGGKLLWDLHASRVLPGFDPNVKIRLLQQLGDQVDVILCIYAGDIERKKIRADFGITYDSDALPLLPAVITQTLTHFKKNVLRGRMMSLDLEETRIALCISALSNPAAQAAVEQLKKLRNCEVHMTHIPTQGDDAGLHKLGVNLTTDTDFSTHDLLVK